MVSLIDIQTSAKLIKDNVLRTPLIYSHTFSKMTGTEVYLKLENLQIGGSFKIRGATHKIQSHLKQIRPKGVIAASVGNHAQGVALAARAADVPATIVMPIWASITKQEATRNYGAEVILQGESLLECIKIGQDLASKSGRMFIHPYDDEEVTIGQATIGLEILEDLPNPDLILVPVGGGGLIAGIATCVKSLRPQTQMVGVQAEACPSAYEALKLGKPVNIDYKNSIADAIMVTEVGESDFHIIREKVDQIVLVSEDQIAEAVTLLLERKKIIAEGGGAVPLAALLGSSLRIPKGSKVVLVISGGNVDSLVLDKIIRQGLRLHGRLMRLSVCLEDVSGSLASLLNLIARNRANVVHIHHSRNEQGLPINFTRVDLELETRGTEHINEIKDVLEGQGYHIKVKR
ncbi:MAG: threonine ammonia-lyase [Methanotrichaceae archaeon]|nr:threonine ammonia-lyase [Methanotrichaceae archaeon]